jgi:serine/threonine protein kinase
MTQLESLIAAALAPRYTVHAEIGHGGMATVYHATDEERGEPVAVKVLNPDLAASVIARRFQREIQVLSALDHPHILPMLDSGALGTVLYFVMPYVTGENLRARLERVGPLPIATAISIARDLASALDYAHARKIIHRDIKPENVLFDEDRAILCDFGVARALDLSLGEGMYSSSVAVGTPHYMSPEQATLGRGLDGRTDIYSLGCVMYEMLTAERPFTGPSAQAIIMRHLRQPPRSIRVVRLDVPEYLEHAVHQAMAKRPEDRPATGGEFVRLLEGPGASASSRRE